jgi:2-oxoglutarate ferredoxin oxidoreductase subunit alpha
MDKRMRKIENIRFNTPVYKYTPHEDPEVLIVGFNGTRGAIEEAIGRLEKDGVKVNHAHIRLIHPFPTDEVLPLVQSAKKVLVVENNATGQLANIIKMNVGNADKIVKFVKYDGNPFLPHEVYTKCKELF